MILTNIFKFKKPELTDPATVASYISENAQIAEEALKNSISVQTNTSTTAYTSSFPIGSYVNSHSFVFIPLYSATGNATINVNGKGVKKLFLENGTTQISAAAHFQKGIQYLLIYNSNLDSGIGAYKTIRLSPEIPAGQVNYFARNTAPSGWLVCNGQAVSRSTYSDLFAAIGTTFGAGNGSTTFNLPDLRGEFIRGWDNGRNIDTGRAFGSSQASSRIRAENESQPGISHVESGAEEITDIGNVWLNTHGGNYTRATIEYSIRPRNVALLPCIKF